MCSAFGDKKYLYSTLWYITCVQCIVRQKTYMLCIVRQKTFMLFIVRQKTYVFCIVRQTDPHVVHCETERSMCCAVWDRKPVCFETENLCVVQCETENICVVQCETENLCVVQCETENLCVVQCEAENLCVVYCETESCVLCSVRQMCACVSWLCKLNCLNHTRHL